MLFKAIRRLDPTRAEIAAMAARGFQYLGEYGIPARCYFAKEDCHVHGFLVGEGQWHSDLRFRDHLRAAVMPASATRRRS